MNCDLIWIPFRKNVYLNFVCVPSFRRNDQIREKFPSEMATESQYWIDNFSWWLNDWHFQRNQFPFIDTTKLLNESRDNSIKQPSLCRWTRAQKWTQESALAFDEFVSFTRANEQKNLVKRWTVFYGVQLNVYSGEIVGRDSVERLSQLTCYDLNELIFMFGWTSNDRPLIYQHHFSGKCQWQSDYDLITPELVYGLLWFNLIKSNEIRDWNQMELWLHFIAHHTDETVFNTFYITIFAQHEFNAS